MPPPLLSVMKVPPGLAWRVSDAGQTVGAVSAWVRPDERCSVFFDSCRADAYQPLLTAVAENLGRDLYASVDENDQELIRYAELGFEVNRRESHYLIPTSPDVTGLGSTEIPAGLAVISARESDEDRLRLLDDALRQDVPGADGWRWDSEGFRRETFSPAFDPATYLVAIEQATWWLSSRRAGQARSHCGG